jgi:nitrile hydratase
VKVASDLGGVAGYGRVEPEPDEPVFHDRWESRVLALTLAMGATRSWTLDRSRFAREDRPVAQYVSIRYYDLWLRALERLLLEARLVGEDELTAGLSTEPPARLAHRLESADVDGALRRGSLTTRPTSRPAQFAIGDEVATSTVDPVGHTRLPSYARGKRGRITAIHGCHVFPDTNARGLGEDPQWLYTVEFTATELFGVDGDPRSVVSVDAFEPYLEVP